MEPVTTVTWCSKWRLSWTSRSYCALSMIRILVKEEREAFPLLSLAAVGHPLNAVMEHLLGALVDSQELSLLMLVGMFQERTQEQTFTGVEPLWAKWMTMWSRLISSLWATTMSVSAILIITRTRSPCHPPSQSYPRQYKEETRTWELALLLFFISHTTKSKALGHPKRDHPL